MYVYMYVYHRDDNDCRFILKQKTFSIGSMIILRVSEGGIAAITSRVRFGSVRVWLDPGSSVG